jgi:ergothioneine biosynthesis protein EgtB
MSPSSHALATRYAAVRAHSLALAEPLSEADCQVQSMPDASPTKWHLAHITWFFETFVLERFEANFQPHHPAFRVLFNSYYQGVGEQHPRAQRGLITRPDLAAVKAYRANVDARMAALLAGSTNAESDAARDTLIEVGLQHEQQHQELLLTDVLHLLSCNPLAPVYRAAAAATTPTAPVPLRWLDFDGGRVDIGHAGSAYAFDNESPRHGHWLQPYALANRLVTQGEWLEFIEDGGYGDARWWLSAGWDWLRAQGTCAPLYWRRGAHGETQAGAWQRFTLAGLQAIDAAAAVCHVSLYEADAYAHWRAARDGQPLRLPTEVEWEHAASTSRSLLQLFDTAWQWTASSYLPYPGFRPWAGAVGEYNGKFMMNQMVLRGGSCATPPGHTRATYRNFFPPETRWQFSGLRLARDVV